MSRLTDFSEFRRARAIGIWWDQVIHRLETQSSPPEGDGDLAEFIPDLHRTWSLMTFVEPYSDSTFRTLMAKHKEFNDMNIYALTTSPGSMRDQSGTGNSPRFLSLPRRDIRSIAVALATIILVVFGAVSLSRLANTDEPRTSILAPVSTPGADDMSDVVFTVQIPQEHIPTQANRVAELAHFSIPPGTSSTWSVECCKGALVDYVLSGEIQVQAQASILVVRADGTEEVIPANQSVSLVAGDGFLSTNQTVAAIDNPSTEPAELLNWIWVGSESADHEDIRPSGWVRVGEANVIQEPIVFDSLAQLTITRISGPSGSQVQVPLADRSIRLAVPENPKASFVALQSDGDVELWSRSTSDPQNPQKVIAYVVTAIPIDPISE